MILHGNILSLIGDEQVISLQRTKVYVFSDSVLCLGKMSENPISNSARDLESPLASNGEKQNGKKQNENKNTQKEK